MNKFKKTILFDLDGVLNTYDGKYDENFIPNISLIASKWIVENGLDLYVENVTNVKVPAYLIIDERIFGRVKRTEVSVTRKSNSQLRSY